MMRYISLLSGEKVPMLGQGTWRIGDNNRSRKEEVDALKLGMDLGLTLIDTAEMYGKDGGSEERVGEAIAGRRDEMFLVSKVVPQHASRKGTVAACEASLNRLATDRIDLYLLHWPGSIPLEETLAGFADLLKAGKIRYWGVSNFDLEEMRQLVSFKGGQAVATNQVLYNPKRRGIEWDLLPWCRERRVPLIAYSPLDEGRLKNNSALEKIAARHNATPSQIALAWIFRQEMMVIPKAVSADHIRQNRAALDLKLTTADLEVIDAAFPPPTRAVPLETV